MSDISVESTTAPVGEQVSDDSSSVEAKVTIPEVRKHKIKVYGKEHELPEEKVLQYAQKGFASDEKFQQAAKLEKQAQEVLSGIKSKESFFKSMESAGLDRKAARALLEDVLRAEYEEDELPEEEKTRRSERSELEKYKQKEKEEQEKWSKQKEEAETAKVTEQLETEMVDAISKSALPKNELFAKAAFNYMAAALGQGMDLTAKEAVRLVETDFYENIKATLSSLDSKSLKSLVGDKAIQALIKENLVEAQSKAAPFAKPTQAASQEKPKPKAETAKPEQAESISHKQFFSQIRGY
jgi:hypothetical protein